MEGRCAPTADTEHDLDVNSSLQLMVLMTLVATAAAVIGLLISKKAVNKLHLRRHQPFVDSMLNVVGMLISILLGLLVAGALDRYEQIDAEVNREAHSLAQVYRLVAGLPPVVREDIRRSCRHYNDIVLNEEWTMMKQGHMSERAWSIYSSLEHKVVTFAPSTNGETNVHQAVIEAVQGIGEGRRDRAQVLMSRTGFIPVIVAVFSCIVIAFTFLYVTRGVMLHVIMVAFVSICLSFNVGMLYVLSSPFKSGVLIQPSGFAINERMFEVLPTEELHR